MVLFVVSNNRGNNTACANNFSYRTEPWSIDRSYIYSMSELCEGLLINKLSDFEDDFVFWVKKDLSKSWVAGS